MNEINILLVALYRNVNIPIRIMHPLLETIDGVKPHSIFFKHFEANLGKAPTDIEEELFIKKIIELNPRLIGISVLSPYVPIARRLTKLIRENSSALVVWGGIHPTISPESCIHEADMICVGEGEGAIVDIATHLRDGKDYSHINNLWINNRGDIIRNPMRPLIQNLDSLPPLSYGNDSFYFINSNKIIKKDPLLWGSYLWIQTSRGCPFVCSYCVNSLLRPLFKDLGNYTRRRSVDSIIKEIRNNLSGTMDYVYFLDETFGNDESWLDEFESRYKKEIGLPFTAEYHPKMVNIKMLNKLVNSGLHTIKIGIQAGTDHIRNHIFHRAGKNKDIILLAKNIINYGVTIRYDLILDNPYDTEASLKNCIRVLLQLPKPLSFNLYSLQYFPDYPLTKKALEDGFIKIEDANIERLMETNLKNWSISPRLLPYNKKQALQNIIWLVVWGHVSNKIVRFGVFGNSWLSKLCFIYMNFKAIIFGKILGIGGIVYKNSWMRFLINGFKHILKGNIKILFLKIKKHIFIYTYKRKIMHE
ncbi:MAG: radical SAM protein [Candidatus Omnitrophica bacterium]|nr:radical SAM protein [Candidatus Omnitrophota bacterium]